MLEELMGANVAFPNLESLSVREERARIARELHDTLLQAFFGASMQLGVALDALPKDSPVKPRLDRVLQIMSQCIEEGRSTIQGLRSCNSRTLDLSEVSGGEGSWGQSPGGRLPLKRMLFLAAGSVFRLPRPVQAVLPSGTGLAWVGIQTGWKHVRN